MLTTQIPALIKWANTASKKGGTVRELAETIGVDVLACQRLFQNIGLATVGGEIPPGVSTDEFLIPIALWMALTALKYRPRPRL
jgi:hypothetical protein